MNARAAHAKFLWSPPFYMKSRPFKATTRVNRSVFDQKHAKVSHSKHLLATKLARKGGEFIESTRSAF